MDEKFSKEGTLSNDFFSFRDTIFLSGTLTNALTPRSVPQSVLTTEEESQLLDAKKIINELMPELENKKELLRVMLSKDYKKRADKIIIMILDKTTGISREARVEDIETMRVELQNKILEYIQFIAGKGSKFLYSRNFKRAESEFIIAFEYLEKSHGPDNVETLKIHMDYEIAKLHMSTFENIASLEETIKNLEHKLLEDPLSDDTKRAISVGRYAIAQYYFNNDDLDKSAQHIERSQALRIEYGASEKDLDRIRFFYAKVANKQGNYAQAWEALQKCYHFRNSMDKLNPDLIAVLMEIDNYFERSSSPSDRTEMHLRILMHLYDIQVHCQYSEREEIRTQLKMLKLMMTSTGEIEYWSLMKRIEVQLNSIEITEESVEVGHSYLELATTRRSSILPQDWSKSKQRAYHFETLGIINKAEMHLRVGYEQDNDIFRYLNGIRDDCRAIANFFKDIKNCYLIGEKVHPEDEAELASLNREDEPADESSTEKSLKVLSEFSSEVDHNRVEDLDRLLTSQDFEELPEEGFINPYRLRLAQGGISSEFTDGKSLEKTRQLLIDDPKHASKIPPVEIGLYNDKIYSFDTRRVVVHQQAREQNQAVQIRYKKISGQHLQKRIDVIFSPRPWNGIVTAIRYGGKNSASTPYINPPLRDQLERKVNREFKSFPSDRSINDDPNGFPMKKKRAQKICSFFQVRAKKGSKPAKEVLHKARQICDTLGEEEMYNFFIRQKVAAINKQESSMDIPLKTKSEKKSDRIISHIPEGAPEKIAGGTKRFKKPVVSLDASEGSGQTYFKSGNSKSSISFFKTAGQGNCFFHAVFGVLRQNRQYEADNVKIMRQEWHDFLAQYNSLSDQDMPAELKEQLKISFVSMLQKLPGEFSAKEKIKGLIDQTKNRLETVNRDRQDLIIKIIDLFKNNVVFREALYHKIQEIHHLDGKIFPTLSDLLENDGVLLKIINENIFDCSTVVNPQISRDEFNERYNSEWHQDKFCNSPILYQEYVSAIIKPNYYIFIEEIRIIASISNRSIALGGDGVDDPQIFTPIPRIFEAYKVFCQSRQKESTHCWPECSGITYIHLGGVHYSRSASFNIIPDDSLSSLRMNKKT